MTGRLGAALVGGAKGSSRHILEGGNMSYAASGGTASAYTGTSRSRATSVRSSGLLAKSSDRLFSAMTREEDGVGAIEGSHGRSATSIATTSTEQSGEGVKNGNTLSSKTTFREI